MIHVLEVARIAVNIATALGLNETLTEAIAMGHDLANAPYGGQGNKRLTALSRDDGGSATFCHELGGFYMAQTVAASEVRDKRARQDLKKRIESGPKSDQLWDQPYREILVEVEGVAQVPIHVAVGTVPTHSRDRFFEYPMTAEVLDGIREHGYSWKDPLDPDKHGEPRTLEGQVVRAADNFAYLSQDIDDLMRTGLLTVEELQEAAQGEFTIKRGADYITRKWSDIKNPYDGIDLRGLLDSSSGRRIGTMIRFFVTHNTARHADTANPLKPIPSPFYLTKQVALLELTKDFEDVVTHIWQNVIGAKYGCTEIATENEVQTASLAAVFHLLRAPKNYVDETWYQSLHPLRRHLLGSRFHAYGHAWKMCYKLSHFTWDDIGEVLARYRARERRVELSFQGNGLDLEIAD